MYKKLVTVALAVVACVAPAFAQPVNDSSALWTEARLYRDSWGVPHIYADTTRGLGFAFGQAQAEDHLDAMLMAYRVANGRAAEVLGEAWAASDEFSIRMGHARLAARALQEADDVTHDLCVGFALGVNAWIYDNPDKVPEWAEGVQPQDILALWHAYLVSMAPLDLPDVYRRPPASQTGNAWALAPSRMAEGAASLVINPHQYYDIPFQWYEAHLALDDMDIMGATLFGLPVMLMGHNGALGWALTPNQPDTADVFQEDLSGPQANPRSPALQDQTFEQSAILMYYAQAQPYYVRTAGGMEERFVPSFVSGRGPVLEKDGGLYTWTIGGYREFGGLLQLINMARSRTLGDFQQAMAMQQLPCFHVTYADRAGNIFYLYNARLGSRNYTEAMLANTPPASEDQLGFKMPMPSAWWPHLWGSYATPGELPYILNPSNGYVQACGNPPWLATENAPLNAAEWPAWFVGDWDTNRAQRVRQLLRSGTRNFRDNQSMLYDVVVPGAVKAAQTLVDFARQEEQRVAGLHPDLLTGLDQLADWNFTANTSARGMTFYHVWWSIYRAEAAAEGVSEAELYARLEAADPWALEGAINTAADAARMLRNDLDAVQIPWGEVHKLRRGDREVPFPGAVSGGPIFTSGDFVYDAGEWPVTYGYGYAMAVQFSDPPLAVSVSPFGASEDPESPHFDDQLNLMLDQRFKVALFTREEVMRYAESGYGRRVTLLPVGVEAELQIVAEAPVTATVETLNAAPGNMPAGLHPFSLYVRPDVAEEATPHETRMTFYVPEAVCRLEDLGQLRLYRYNAADGWAALGDQQVDGQRRVLEGIFPGPGTFAVLGPEEVFKAATDSLEMASPEEAVQGQTEAKPAMPQDLKAPEGTFKFDWKNTPPEDVEAKPSSEDESSGPTGSPTFKMEFRSEKPEELPETPEPPKASEGDGPTGKPTFKMEFRSTPRDITPETTTQTGSQSGEGPTGERQFVFERHGAGPSAPSEPAQVDKEPEE
jgi:acyl-homoserine-lactone acylase